MDMVVCINKAGRTGVLLDENPRYRRVLRSAGSGLDVDRLQPLEWISDGWLPLPDARPLSYAHTFGASTLNKTARAVATLKEIIAMTDLNALTVAQLTEEYNRLTGKRTKQFKSKAVALAAITKAQAALVAGLDATSAATAPPATTTEETEMPKTKPAKKTPAAKPAKKTPAAKPAKKTPAAKPAKKTPAAKPAKPAKKTPAAKPAKKTGDARVDRAKRVCATTNGAGGMILKLLREGKDHDAILSRVLSAFPDNATKPTHISWYQSMRRAAGEKVA